MPTRRRTLPRVRDKRAPVEERPRPKTSPEKRRQPRLSPGRIARHRAFPWALFGVALVAAVTFALLWASGFGSGEERQAEVRDTARRFLVALTNFSSERIDQDVAEIRAFGVGQFAEEVEQTFSEDRLAAIRENQVVSTGRVESVFVQSLEGSTASVFGVVNETIVNASLTAPRADVLRVELEMIETPGGWKVNTVEILQSPGAAPFG
jgi:hypothetical protein